MTQVAADATRTVSLCGPTIDLGKSTGGDQGIVVDALKDVLVQLLSLGAVKGHAKNDEGVC